MDRRELKRLQWKLRARVGEIEQLATPTFTQVEEKMQARAKIDAISATLRGEPCPGHAQKAAKELKL